MSHATGAAAPRTAEHVTPAARFRLAGRSISGPRSARALAGAVLLASVVACATNPVTGRREFALMSEGQEIAMGREADVQIRQEMGVYDDPALQAYVSGIGLRMAMQSERPGLPWSFAVVDQPAINAFALPGGFIYVTRGILAFLDSEAELAGVLGHEIGHVTARHSVQQYTRTLGGQIGLVALGAFVPQARPFGEASAQALGLLFLKYGREDELQSDTLGARYAVAQGWDPAGVPGMLSTLGRLDEAAGDRKGVPNFLATHPEPLARVKEITPLVEQLKAGRSGLVTDRAGLQARVDGLVFGDNPEHGIARGSTFLHPPLRFRVDFPAGWEIANSAQQVVTKAPNAELYMVLQLVQQPQGTNARDVGVASMERAGFQHVTGERQTINGLDAYVGLYQGQLEGLGTVTSRAAHIRHADRMFFVAGLAAPAAFPQADAAFTASIRSFRPLSAAEADAVRPARVDLQVARAGDTWASLAEQSGRAITAAALAAMNGSSPSTPPRPGERLKVVVAGS